MVLIFVSETQSYNKWINRISVPVVWLKIFEYKERKGVALEVLQDISISQLC
jgi:hypothetical protein